MQDNENSLTLQVHAALRAAQSRHPAAALLSFAFAGGLQLALWEFGGFCIAQMRKINFSCFELVFWITARVLHDCGKR